MNITDIDEIIKRMMSGSEAVKKNRNKAMKSYRRKNKDGTTSKSHKIRVGKHLKNLEVNNEIYE